MSESTKTWSIIVKFSERLKAVRERNNISSQAELAALLEVSPGTVGNWESARNGPTLGELERIAKVLKEPISYLLGLDDSPLALRDATEVNYWRLLDEKTLKAALQDLSKNHSDESFRALEQVVAEIRSRSPRPSGKPESKAS